MGKKTDDYRAVPLCPACHGEVHRRGRAWAAERGLEGVQVDCLVEWIKARRAAGQGL
jgi:hypothetical protein